MRKNVYSNPKEIGICKHFVPANNMAIHALVDILKRIGLAHDCKDCKHYYVCADRALKINEMTICTSFERKIFYDVHWNKASQK